MEEKKREVAEYLISELSKYTQIDENLTNAVIRTVDSAIGFEEYSPKTKEGGFLQDVLLSKDLQGGRSEKYGNVYYNLREFLKFLTGSLLGSAGVIILPLPYKIATIAGLLIQLHYEVSKLKRLDIMQLEAIIVYYLHSNDAYRKPVPFEEIKQGAESIWRELHGGSIKEEVLIYSIMKLKKFRIIEEHEGKRYRLKEKVKIE